MSTIAEALFAFQRLRDVGAGNLGGMCLRYRDHGPLRLGELPEPWAGTLRAGIDARNAGTITDDTPWYLVFSAGTVIAWCTVDAVVVVPEMPLTRTQARHRRLAVDALGDLARHVLVELADARDARTGFDNRTAMTQPGAIRVAPEHDPTWSFALVIDGDLAKTQGVIARTLQPHGGGTPLVIDARGYGRYGRDRHRLPLAVLCAMHRIATTHAVPLAAVGNWLAAPAPNPPAQAPTDQLEDMFAQAFVGKFASRTDYTEHHMRTRGWTHAVTAAGMDPKLIDVAGLRRHLFQQQVTDVDTDDGNGSIVVLRRPTRSP